MTHLFIYLKGNIKKIISRASCGNGVKDGFCFLYDALHLQNFLYFIFITFAKINIQVFLIKQIQALPLLFFLKATFHLCPLQQLTSTLRASLTAPFLFHPCPSGHFSHFFYFPLYSCCLLTRPWQDPLNQCPGFQLPTPTLNSPQIQLIASCQLNPSVVKTVC